MQERTLNIVMTAVGIALCGTSVGMARHAGFGTQGVVGGIDTADAPQARQVDHHRRPVGQRRGPTT